MEAKSRFPVNEPFHKIHFIRDFKELIDQSEKLYSEHSAYKLKNKDGVYYEVTYSNFRHSVYYLANSLVNDGYKRAHIAVVGVNSYNWCVTYLAVTCSDNIIVPIDKELTTENMMDVIRDSDATVLFGDKKYIKRTLDIFLSLIGLIILFPMRFAIALVSYFKGKEVADKLEEDLLMI